jgi:hypothetical protein
MQVQHRVPDEIARRIFQRLNQDGTLTIILDVLRDHRDTLVKRIEHAYINQIAVTNEQRADLYARHGAASEISRVITTFEALGVPTQNATERPRAAGER